MTARPDAMAEPHCAQMPLPVALNIQQAFDDAMGQCAPFESQPHIAVAVSGGADSMAACLLAQLWASARGGRVTALSVDHGMRHESAAEAQQVARWLEPYAIAHHILHWQGETPARNVQEHARDGRYALLRGWCKAHHVLHLITGHQHDDQRETHVLRTERGSGAYGLAGMALVTEQDEVRVLRPLLHVARASIEAWLTQQGQGWVDDPSNLSARYARSRVRSALRDAQDSNAAIDDALTTLRPTRIQLEHRLADACASCVTAYPEGYARIALADYINQPREIGLRILAGTLAMISGSRQIARMEDVARLYDAIMQSHDTHVSLKPRTLSGCLVAGEGKELLCITRENNAIESGRSLEGAGTTIWDNRFRIHVSPHRAMQALRVEALGEAHIRQLQKESPGAYAHLMLLPRAVRTTLPALSGLDGLLAVPHIRYDRGVGRMACCVEFCPPRPLLRGWFL